LMVLLRHILFPFWQSWDVSSSYSLHDFSLNIRTWQWRLLKLVGPRTAPTASVSQRLAATGREHTEQAVHISTGLLASHCHLNGSKEWWMRLLKWTRR
jgi:hypothetical protein